MTDHQRCEDRIRDLEGQVQASAARAVAREREHVAAIEAERRAGALRVERIRAAILDGASDSAQRAAAEHASNAVFAMAHGVRIEREVAVVAPAYLALAEAFREARAELARLREMGRAIAEAT